MMMNKSKSVQVLTKGVEFLFKKNKVSHIKGKAVLFSKNDIVVYENEKGLLISLKALLLPQVLTQLHYQVLKLMKKMLFHQQEHCL